MDATRSPRRGIRRRRPIGPGRGLALLLGLALGTGLPGPTGCASDPPAPRPGTSTLTGRVDLVAPPAARSGGRGTGYGDRRLRTVSRFDYSRPGFAVVYVVIGDDGAIGGIEESGAAEDAPPERLGHAIEIVDGTLRSRLEPASGALRVGERIRLANPGGQGHAVSIPSLDWVRTLAPGASAEVVVDRAGEHDVYLVDRPGVRALVFAAPGPFDRVSGSGRYAIPDLPPGRHAVHAWHPRLPPTRRPVELRPDVAEHVDLALGVGVDAGVDAGIDADVASEIDADVAVGETER